MTDLITEPGIYDVAEDTYHAARNLAPELGHSLSSTGAKTILRSPALFDYQRRHPVQKDVFDVGSVAHALILRSGTFTVIDCYDWKLKANQTAKAAARARGEVVVHRGDLLAASKMARAVRRHALASAILSQGQPEQSLYWTDEATGVTCRGRTDWLRDNAIVDVKTTNDASPTGFAKACANFGYDQQADWYSTGVEAITGRRLPFLFIAVEKEPPHLVAVYQLDDDALDRGARRNRQALELFAECESAGEWPGYSTDIEVLSLPRWAN